MNKKITLFLGLLFGLCLATILTGYSLLWAPYHGAQSPSVQVSIKAGSSLKQISNQLDRAQVIRSKNAFFWAARIKGVAPRFRQGVYRFDHPLSAFEVMAILVRGEEHLLQITIPEGYRMTEIFALLRASGFTNPGQYETWATKKSFIDSLKLPGNPKSLEGFLYPETYRFSPSTSERAVLRHLVKTFKDHLPPRYAARAKSVGLSPYQAVTLASIIEKETGKGTERPLISSVFHNRMKIKMRLQTDPTVIYGIKNYKGNITRKHLRTYSIYNTYMIPGLPPTPIASPGLAALNAAVSPAKTKFLYFVGKGDGSHQFTKTLRAHNNAVRKFQHRRRKDYRSY